MLLMSLLLEILGEAIVLIGDHILLEATIVATLRLHGILEAAVVGHAIDKVPTASAASAASAAGAASAASAATAAGAASAATASVEAVVPETVQCMGTVGTLLGTQ